jgi:transposase
MEPDPILSHPMLVAAQAEMSVLRSDNARLREDNAALRLEMGKLREAMERLQKVLEAVQTQLSKDSHNSSKPPSSDGPKAPPRPPAAPSGRKRGGQPGRKGKARPSLPEGSENRRVEVKLEVCPHCAHPFPPSAISGTYVERTLDLVHQLVEVTAFVLEEGQCPHCHREARAHVPPEAGVGELGPNLRALAAYLRTQGRMSLGPLHFFFKEILKVDVSRGWLYKSGIGVSEAVAPTWEILRESIRNALVVNMDETGFGRLERNWIWVALSARTVFFHFSDTRGYDALKAILPETFNGYLCTDRYAVYHKLKAAMRQFCWAHLRREFIALSEMKNPEVASVGKKLLEDQERVFVLWHCFRKGEIDRMELRSNAAVILARIKRNLRQASLMKVKEARNLGTALVENWAKLWTFLKIDGVAPTNNCAERALRPLVIMKRIFQRLPSDGGKQFFERLVSAGATARVRGVPFFDWLIKAFKASRTGDPPPALEPV